MDVLIEMCPCDTPEVPSKGEKTYQEIIEKNKKNADTKKLQRKHKAKMQKHKQKMRRQQK